MPGCIGNLLQPLEANRRSRAGRWRLQPQYRALARLAGAGGTYDSGQGITSSPAAASYASGSSRGVRHFHRGPEPAHAYLGGAQLCQHSAGHRHRRRRLLHPGRRPGQGRAACKFVPGGARGHREASLRRRRLRPGLPHLRTWRPPPPAAPCRGRRRLGLGFAHGERRSAGLVPGSLPCALGSGPAPVLGLGPNPAAPIRGEALGLERGAATAAAGAGRQRLPAAPPERRCGPASRRPRRGPTSAHGSRRPQRRHWRRLRWRCRGTLFQRFRRL
mmetsp:Transcript_50687/g.110663  ORF Transcript_50687/g.110663 Transcript_50687/m.110663 type:complete len:274 (-) Transcript_50687:80-901(-)